MQDRFAMQFDVPDHGAKLRLSEMLRLLPLSELVDDSRSDVIRTDLDTAMGLLWASVLADYDSHERESDRCYSFRYLVEYDATLERLAVLTRLHLPGDGAGVCYGRYVRRIAVEQCLLWIDD
jgi:hypothetical protein